LNEVVTRTLRTPLDFSLSQTCAPVCWARQRSPRHEWMSGALVTVETRDERIVWRQVTQPEPELLHITGNEGVEPDPEWARRVLGFEVSLPRFTDPTVRNLAHVFPGLRPYADGSLFDGIITSIVGQSISVISAAATQHKLAAAFAEPVVIAERAFYPLPAASQLADASVGLIRSSGVTWKRAEAIRFAARAQLNGELPDDQTARTNPDEARHALLALPLVGPWTAESALLWGIGAPDAHPSGDVALLRAARHVYDRPGMTLKDLDALSEGWRPARALAARLMWTALFGVAPPQ
jgi:DNA-3-methyladenine glycosylase II